MSDPEGPDPGADLAAQPEADEPIDDFDLAVLGQLDRVMAQVDPQPSGLDQLVSFALAVENVDHEVARLAEADSVDSAAGRLGPPVGAGHRGHDEGVHTVAFESDRWSILLSIVDTGEGRVRLDGWVAPAASLRVTLRGSGADTTTQSDVAGGFVFADVAAGLVQLVVGSPDDGSGVVTPAFSV